MCTAITFKGKDNYFGRTLDVEVDYKTSIVICPRNYMFDKLPKQHYAIIGMAIVLNNYPLYFDATNEYGLSMAGLNFPGNAKYFDEKPGKINLAVYEFIPYVLGKCKTISDVKNFIYDVNVTSKEFENMPSTPLHWIISDCNFSITVEQTATGIHVYDNDIGVLTNNPTFDWHITNLVNYLNITNEEATNRMLKDFDLKPFCKGMGGIGLPGDLSSPSRFIRVTFAKNRALKYASGSENVNQFFHILENVSQTTGLAQAGNSYEKTLYTSCCNVNKGIYYYKTYSNSQIEAVNINNVNLDDSNLFVYPLNYNANINYLN